MFAFDEALNFVCVEVFEKKTFKIKNMFGYSIKTEEKNSSILKITSTRIYPSIY
jgi:hypothetical protein